MLLGSGELTDGTTVDVLHGSNGGPFPAIDPAWIYTPTTKYMTNIVYGKPYEVKPFAQYLCRQWNYGSRGSRAPLRSLKLFRNERLVVVPDQPPSGWVRREIFDYDCELEGLKDGG